MSEINFQKINITRFEHGTQNEEAVKICTPSFLKMTASTDYAPVVGIVRKSSDVISGAVQDEIDTLNQEAGIINSVISENANASTEFSAVNIGRNAAYKPKIIGHTTYVPTLPPEGAVWVPESHALSEHTNTSRLIGCLQYSPLYNEAQQRTLLTGAVNILADWLDDMIINYQDNVAEGIARGDSEVKLSFLLRLRKQIENCDFPVGFGDDYLFAESTPNSVILGSYSSSFLPEQYLNVPNNAQGNNAAMNHTDRSIILNAGAFMPDRLYSNEAQLRVAIEAGEPVTIGDVLMASTAFYNNYSQVYLASVLAHELIHATHIINEAVTYNTCELIEDDFRDRAVFSGWSAETQAAVNTLGIPELSSLNDITFGDAFIPQEVNATAGIGFHDLVTLGTGANSVVMQGYDENCAYDTWLWDFDGYFDGNGNPIRNEYSFLECYNGDSIAAKQAILAELNNFSAYT